MTTEPLERSSALVGAPISFKTRLTDDQLEALRACAKGLSLRFERSEIVAALIAGGYAERNVAGVITITPKGHEYLRARDTDSGRE